MAELGSRIRQVLTEKGLSQAELARLVGVKQQTISYICAPDSPASASRYASRIAQVLGVNPSWLQDGEGDKHDPIVRIEMNGVEISMRRIPLLAQSQVLPFVSGKKPKTAVMAITTDAEVGKDAFAFEVFDESMSPKFVPGDRVVIDQSVEPVPGDFVAAQSAGALVFRKYRARGDGFELVPLNDDWPVIASRGVKIIGVMAEHRSYRRKR